MLYWQCHSWVVGRVGLVTKNPKVGIDTWEREVPLVMITSACGSITQEVGVELNLIRDIVVGQNCESRAV